MALSQYRTFPRRASLSLRLCAFAGNFLFAGAILERRKELPAKTQSPQSFAFSAQHTALLVFAVVVLLSLALTGHAQVNITIDHNTGKAATSEFKFKHVPSPARDDAATKTRDRKSTRLNS